MGKADRDWRAWHEEYDDPGSSLSRRLTVVRETLTGVLDSLVAAGRRDVTLVSLCSGDGRDTLPVLAGTHGLRVRATLVELDPELAERARTGAEALGLDGVEVVTADAGLTASCVDRLPCDVLMLCGIFGNIDDDDVRRTVASVPAMLVRGGVVIWTRGRSSGPDDPARIAGDPAEWVRDRFADAALEEVAFVRPEDAGFRVGAHRLVAAPVGEVPARLFRFV